MDDLSRTRAPSDPPPDGSRSGGSRSDSSRSDGRSGDGCSDRGRSDAPPDAPSADASHGAGEELDLMALLPRLVQLGRVVDRGSLVERAMEQAGPGLDRPALNVLLQLRMADGPLRVGEIAHRMQVVGPHVTRQVNELERRRLVRRVVAPDDQRARLVEATAEGTACAERYFRAIFGYFDRALADWSREDRGTLGRLLSRFTDDLTAHLAALDVQDRGTGPA